MGLDICVDDDSATEIWHGPYTAFSRFRGMVAQQYGMRSYSRLCGVALPKLNGDSAGPAMASSLAWLMTMNDDNLEAKATKEVDKLHTKSPELVCFFNHSDCDGNWTAQECKDIAAMLREVRGKPVPDIDRAAWFRETIDAFLEGLDTCVERGVGAVFC